MRPYDCPVPGIANVYFFIIQRLCVQLEIQWDEGEDAHDTDY